MKSFSKNEKIAFNIKVNKYKLNNELSFLYLLLIIEKNRVYKYIILFKYILYYRISLIAISSHDLFIIIKRKYFNV